MTDQLQGEQSQCDQLQGDQPKYDQPPNIGWPCAEKSDSFIVSVIQILRIFPRFVSFVHHFIAKMLLMIRSDKKKVGVNYGSNITCDECVLTSEFSADSRRENAILRVEGFFTVVCLIMKIHKCFEMIHNVTKLKPENVDDDMLKITKWFQSAIRHLYPNIYTDEHCGDALQLLVQIIERYNQVVLICKENIRDKFPDSNYFKDFDFIEDNFVNSGTASAKSPHCQEETKQKFSFIEHSIKIPPVDFENDQIDIDEENFISTAFYNMGRKRVKLNCDCISDDVWSENLDITSFALVQIVRLDRITDLGNGLIVESNAKAKIPVVLKCLCNDCFENRVHQLYLIGIIATKNDSGEYVTYLRDNEYFDINCTSANCCSYINKNKNQTVEEKFNIKFIEIQG